MFFLLYFTDPIFFKMIKTILKSILKKLFVKYYFLFKIVSQETIIYFISNSQKLNYFLFLFEIVFSTILPKPS